ILPLLLGANVLTAISRHEISRNPRLPNEIAGLVKDEPAIVLQDTIRKFQYFFCLVIVNVVQHTVSQNNVRSVRKRIKRPIFDASGKEICPSTRLKLDPCRLDVSVADIKSHILHPWQTI